MQDDQIDRAIDAVAREMTGGAPHGDLRARVIARIDGAGAPRRMPAGGLGIVRALFAVAAIVAVLIAYREMRPPVRPAPKNSATAALQTDAARPRMEAAPAAASPSIAARRQPSSVRPQLFTIPPSAIDELAPPPVAVAPLPLAADIDARPIDVPPLDPIAPIAVAPPGEGDRQ